MLYRLLAKARGKNKMNIRFSNTLINAVDWYLTAPNTPCKDVDGETWKSIALQQLKGLIFKTPYVMLKEKQQGITFEETLYKFSLTNKKGRSEHFNSLLANIKGGIFQKWMPNLILNINYKDKHYNVSLCGKIDVLMPDKIIDIKTTNSYKQNKYIYTYQHYIYCLGEQVTEFEYHVIEWDSYPNIKNYYLEKFKVTLEELNSVYKEKLINKIIECLSVIDKLGYLEIYETGV